MKRDVQRRLSERIGLGAVARIVAGEACVVDCKVLDLSTTGAKLEIPWRSSIPNEFTLCVPSRGIERRVEAVWSSGDEIGVHFLFDSQPGAAEVPVIAQAAAPKPVVAERGAADLPVPRRSDDFRNLAIRLREQLYAGKPARPGATFRGPLFWLALVIFGVFGSVMLIWPKSDRGALTNPLLSAERSNDNTSRQRGPQIPSSDGQPGDSNATFASVEGIGSTVLGALDRAGGKVTKTLTGTALSDGLAISGNHPSPSRSDDDRAATLSISQPPHGLNPLTANAVGPAAFPEPVIPALLPAPAGERSPNSSTTSIMTLSQLDDSEIRAVKGCLAAVMDVEPIDVRRSLPHFVLADACLPRRVMAGQKPPR